MKAVTVESGEIFQATVPALLLRQVREAAQVNQLTLDEFTTEALIQLLARQTLQRFHLAAEGRRAGISDDEVERYVEDVIHDHRREGRDRPSPGQ